METGWLHLAGDGPLYRQLYTAVQAGILDGRLRPGARLPSTRTLADELGLSRNVVLLAFSQLETEGYVEGRRGSGTYVVENLPQDTLRSRATRRRTGSTRAPVPRLSAQAKRALEFTPPPRSTGLRYDFRYGDVPRDPTTIALWRRHLLRHVERAPLGYADARGLSELRDALCRYLELRRGIDCDASRILVTCGSQQGLELVGRCLIEPGMRVAVEDPGYGGAKAAFHVLGAQVCPVAVDRRGMRVEQLVERAPDARLCYVTPSHQFPTGAIMPLARRLSLLEWARLRDAFVIEDDYDGEFRYRGRPIEPLTRLDPERAIYLGSFSKVLFPAVRIGYVVLPESLVAPAATLRWLSVRHGSTLEQLALTDLLASGDFERHLRRMRRQNARRREALLQALERHLGERVQTMGTDGGAHLFLWLKDLRPAQLAELIRRAAALDVGIYPVTPYFSSAPRRAGLLLGFTTLTESAIAEGIRRLARALASVGKR